MRRHELRPSLPLTKVQRSTSNRLVTHMTVLREYEVPTMSAPCGGSLTGASSVLRNIVLQFASNTRAAVSLPSNMLTCKRSVSIRVALRHYTPRHPTRSLYANDSFTDICSTLRMDITITIYSSRVESATRGYREATRASRSPQRLPDGQLYDWSTILRKSDK